MLLADEPTGNVDMRTGQEILTLFGDAQRELGQTIVMVTHDPRSAGYGDEVLLLRDGNSPATLDLTEACRGAAKTDRTTTPGAGHVLKWLEKLDSTGAVEAQVQRMTLRSPRVRSRSATSRGARVATR